MKVVTDHGWPKASDGNDEHAIDAFKNERDYIARHGAESTVAAMDWAVREIERLRAINADMLAALRAAMPALESMHDPDHRVVVNARAAIAIATGVAT